MHESANIVKKLQGSSKILHTKRIHNEANRENSSKDLGEGRKQK